MSGVSAADITTWASEFLTAAGVFFAGWQVRESRRRSRLEQQLELESVSLSWRPKVVPTRSEADPEGRTTSRYYFAVDNPGTLAIRDIRVTVRFDKEIERIHHNEETEPPTIVLVLDTPVIPARGQRIWKRSIRIAFDDRVSLRNMTGELAFVHPEDPKVDWVSHWGRGTVGGVSRRKRPMPAAPLA